MNSWWVISWLNKLPWLVRLDANMMSAISKQDKAKSAELLVLFQLRGCLLTAAPQRR